MIHVERSPAAARSVAPDTFVVPDAVTACTLVTRPDGPRVSFSAVTGARSFRPLRIVASATGVGPQR